MAGLTLSRTRLIAYLPYLPYLYIYLTYTHARTRAHTHVERCRAKRYGRYGSMASRLVALGMRTAIPGVAGYGRMARYGRA